MDDVETQVFKFAADYFNTCLRREGPVRSNKLPPPPLRRGPLSSHLPGTHPPPSVHNLHKVCKRSSRSPSSHYTIAPVTVRLTRSNGPDDRVAQFAPSTSLVDDVQGS